MAASLVLGGHPLNTTCKTLALSLPFTPLSLSTTCTTTLSLSLPFPALSLSLSSSSLSLLPVQQKKPSRSYLIYCAAADIKSNRTEQVNQLLDWFEKQTMEAKEMIEKLRKEYEIIVAKLLLDEDEEDVHALLAFYLELDSKWRESSRDKLCDKKYNPLWNWNWKRNYERVRDCAMYLGKLVNYVLDWFEEDLMEVEELNQKLRKEYEMIAQKLFDEAEGEKEGVLLADLDEMFSNLSEKQAKAIQAKAKAAEEADKKAKVDKLLSPVFVFL